MQRYYYSKNDDLQPFFEEINRYADGVHDLQDGARPDSIEKLESDLQIKLPQVYKDFLQVCNGGELFVPGTVLAEIYNPSNGPKQRGGSYLDESFQLNRRRMGMPDSYLPIADLNYGDTICIDLETSDGYDSKIFQWDRETQGASRTWGSFAEWLMDALEEGSMLVDYDGNDKELEF